MANYDELTPVQKMQVGRARKTAEDAGQSFDQDAYIAEHFGSDSAPQNEWADTDNSGADEQPSQEDSVKPEDANQGAPDTTGDVTTQEQNTDAAAGTGAGVVGSISERLSNQESGKAEVENTGAPQMREAMPFDITQLTTEQLQQLKRRLDATPDKAEQDITPTIHLRKLGGKHVIEIGRARSVMVFDATERREVERFRIPVKFLEGGDFVDVDYNEFMLSERVVCPVVNKRETVRPVVEGKVFSKERGVEVEQVYKIVDTWFTVSMPDGRTIELSGGSVNL